MRLLADESVDNGIIKNLRILGIEVLSISETSPGIDDTGVLKTAFENNLLLVTEDKDFGELAYRLKMKHKGILLIRMAEISREERLKVIPQMIKDYFDKLSDNFSVLTSSGLRIKSH